MPTALTSTKSLVIDAPLAKVWKALTLPVYSKKYMFNCEVITSWEIGSSIEWKGNYEGYDAHQIGKVIEFEPMSRIKYSTFDPNFGLKDLPENYIHVTYELQVVHHTVHLSITNSTFDGNKERMGHVLEGWSLIMEKIKTTAESI